MPDNQKIDNSKLETLLDEFAQDRQKEKYAKVMDVLERSVIMVPTMKPQNLDAET
jgi:predicted house-cleaning noncanonical NTP pyrophosphatase (MazG superfamily)